MEIQKEHREKVEKLLGVNDKEEGIVAHREMVSREKGIGTGSWLLDRDVYLRQWIDTKSSASALYGITGPENFGKSFLAKTVIEKLHNEHDSKEAKPSVLTAHY
jgi:hypothetical protein